MKAPIDVYKEIRSESKTSENPILVGKLKIIPPNGKTILSKERMGTVYESVLPQTFELQDVKKKPTVIDTTGLHSLKNRYFLKPLGQESRWIFVGESDDSTNLFPINLDLKHLKTGVYLLSAIITGKFEEGYSFMAEDSIIVEII